MIKNIFNLRIRSMSSKPKVLRIGQVAFAHKKWEELGEIAEVIHCDSKNRQEFLKDLQTKYDGVVSIARDFPSVEITGRFDQEVANALPSSVKTLSHCGAGYDQIDVQPFTDKGIQVSNVTVPVEAPTADTAVYLAITATRNFQIGHELTVQGKWPTGGKAAGTPLGHCPEGKTLGILGLGGIGRAIHRRMKPFGYKKIIYHNRSRLSTDLEDGAEYVSFDELLSTSDIIMISIPLNANTRNLIAKDTISKMKDGVVIINTARGAIIDEEYLYEALKSGKIGAFGGDVFTKEPEVAKELLELPNVVSLPHMGTHTYEAIQNMEEWVVANIETFLYTGKVKTIVPEQSKTEFEFKPILTK